MGNMRHDIHHVARQFDIDRSLEAITRIQDAINLAKGINWIGQFHAGHTQFLEHLGLSAEVANLVMQQRVVHTLVQSRGTRDDHDR